MAKEVLDKKVHFQKQKGGIKMAKLTAVVVTILGILLLLPLIKVDIGAEISSWLIAIGVLIIGISKLMRNFKK